MNKNDKNNRQLASGITSEVAVGRDDQSAPIQLVQAVFDELTSVKQSITDNYNQAFKLDFSDLDVLHSKVQQAVSQYHVISKTCSATIFYVNGEKQDLSSFEQFAFQSSTGDSPVESLLYRFNLLIVPPQALPMLGTLKPQTYHIEINLASGVGLRKKFASNDFAGVPASLLRVVGRKPASMKIEYVDYTVAKAMQSVIGGWFSTLNHTEESKLLKTIQAKSHYIPTFCVLTLVIATSLFIFHEIPNIFLAKSDNLTTLSQLAIVSFIFLYITRAIATFIGNFVEQSIDSWTPISYIDFNKGDKAEIRKSEAFNKKSLIKAIGGLIFTCCFSIFNKIASGFLLHLVLNH